jgi:hypothetical protein
MTALNGGAGETDFQPAVVGDSVNLGIPRFTLAFDAASRVINLRNCRFFVLLGASSVFSVPLW